ncbi:MAG: VC1465 family Xer recombination activation factor [Proteobacteria bacterium]|nr:VC1465 family Xer recombination activation factor [Pseudomonadota bacterium]
MTIKSPPPRHYAKSEKDLGQLLGRSLLERQHIARKFLSARQQLGWTHQECAKVLRVTTRTLRYWEAAEVRIPYAAFKLMRVLASGRYLGDAWRNFFVRGDVLVSPEGHEFAAGDLAWWSLCTRQAEAFREIMHKQRRAHREGADATNGASATVGAPAPTPLATAMRGHVLSKASTSRGTRPAAQEDPSAGHVASNSGTDESSKVTSSDGQRLDPKSLKSKRILPESLSLTLPDRPANPPIAPARSHLDEPSLPVCACGRQGVAA